MKYKKATFNTPLSPPYWVPRRPEPVNATTQSPTSLSTTRFTWQFILNDGEHPLNSEAFTLRKTFRN